jgi:DNA-binding response OmpR family regulator
MEGPIHLTRQVIQSRLTVDDEAAITADLQRNLRQFGYGLDLAHEFETARASMGNDQFGLILEDFNLASERCEHPRSGEGIRVVRRLDGREQQSRFWCTP